MQLVIFDLSAIFVLALVLTQKWIVIHVFQLKKADPRAYPLFYEVVEELCQKFWLTKSYPLYIWNTSAPNACAFGGGGRLGAIAITSGLYEKLSREELKAVVAHEIAHLRCRDVWLSTLLIGISGLLELKGRWLVFVAIRTWILPAAVLGLFMLFLNKVFFPLGIAAISQEREYTADKLAAYYCGTPDHLISALKILHPTVSARREPSVYDQLWYHHPWFENRIENLREGTVTIPEPKGT